MYDYTVTVEAPFALTAAIAPPTLYVGANTDVAPLQTTTVVRPGWRIPDGDNVTPVASVGLVTATALDPTVSSGRDVTVMVTASAADTTTPDTEVGISQTVSVDASTADATAPPPTV